MSVEIRGTTTSNKGAQLMLESVAERLGSRCQLSAPTAVLDFDVRATLGIRQTLHVNRFPRLSARLGGAIPDEVRRRYGLVADSEITGVLDASGFAYSDSFGPRVSRREALYGRAWLRRGVPKILLPQAFGPFQNPELTAWASEVMSQASVVFVRDRTSMQHVKKLNLPVDLALCPDFTIGVAPLKVSAPVTGDYAAIVPNNKLITRGLISEPDYIDLLVEMGRASLGEGVSPLVVVHESTDARLATLVAARLEAPTFTDPRPRALKGVIGGSKLLIGSRFHAIVGGLSQSVRTIAIGWSHKYGELLGDFGVPEWAVGPELNASAMVTQVLNDDGALTRLRDARAPLMQQVEQMWSDVEEILALGPRESPSAHAPEVPAVDHSPERLK